MNLPPLHQLRISEISCDYKRRKLCDDELRIEGVSVCNGMATLLSELGIPTRYVKEEYLFEKELMLLFEQRGFTNEDNEDSFRRERPMQWELFFEYKRRVYDDRIALLRIFRGENLLGQVTLGRSGDLPHFLRQDERELLDAPYTEAELEYLEAQPLALKGIVAFERGLGSFVLDTVHAALQNGESKYNISVNPHPYNAAWISKLAKKSADHPGWMWFRTSFNSRDMEAYEPFHEHFWSHLERAR